MFCPKCGNKVDMFADKCLKCGKSFKGLSMAERQRLELKPRVRQNPPKRKKPTDRIEPTPIRMTYDNGIPVGEGMSVLGTRMRRGAHRPFYLC